MSFEVKSIYFHGKRSILSQSVNGPCALLAIVNTILLQTTEQSPAEHHQLVALVNSGERTVALESIQPILYSLAVNNLQQRGATPEETQAILNLLPSLNEGLNVDPHFAGGFTPSVEVSVFDVFGLKIVHGWIIDPQSPEYANVIKHNSYEEAQGVLVEAYEKQQAGETQGEIIEDSEALKRFMAHTATQLTDYGLGVLKRSLLDEEICVFFRNNHFNTIIKHELDVYQLVTDQGFLKKRDFVWESLLSVNGSINSFFTGNFQPLVEGETVEDEDEDEALARQMQEEEDQRVAKALQKRYEGNKRTTAGNGTNDSTNAAAARGSQSNNVTSSEGQSSSKCCVIM